MTFSLVAAFFFVELICFAWKSFFLCGMLYFVVEVLCVGVKKRIFAVEIVKEYVG